MKFLVDAQLPPALALWLREAGHDAQAVREVGLREAEDAEIWNRAMKTGEVLITKDEDFPTRAMQSDVSPVIVWLRIGNTSNRALLGWLLPFWPDVIARIESGDNLVEVRENGAK